MPAHFLTAVLLVAASPAFATGPQFHVVTGVPSGDVLNVRAAPSAGAADIGDLAPDGAGVAVLEQDESRAWGHIDWQGGTGWVSMRHLEPAFARGPRLFRVAGVPAGDVLNVRAEPSAASQDIGDAGGNGALVEVLGAGPEAKWGRIVHGEGNGWVALRYLAPAEPETVADSPIPVGLHCTGTEPFWSLRVGAPDRVTFSEPGTGVQPTGGQAAILWAAAASGRQAFPAALRARGKEGEHALVLHAEACTDGMSDRIYGWSANLITGERLLTGCCQVQPDEGAKGSTQ